MPVTVTIPKGSYANGLTAADFRLLDNGVEQNFRLLTAEEVQAPVSMVVAVQLNDIARSALLKIRRTGSLIEPLITGSGGRAALVTYSATVRRHLEFSSDGDQIIAAFKQLSCQDERDAHLLDAVNDAFC